MNKKLLLIAMLAIVGSSSYALDYTQGDKDLVNQIPAIEADKNAIRNELESMGNKFEGQINSMQGQMNANQDFINKIPAIEADKDAIRNELEANKAGQAEKDAAQDAEIAKGDRVNNVQNKQIGALQTENIEQNKEIAANKDAIAANKAEQADKDAAQDKEIAANKDALNNKVDRNTFEQAYNEFHMGQSFTDETLKTHRQEIDALDEVKVDKAEQAEKDAAQDAEIAKGDRVNNVQNKQIGALQTENVEQNKKIAANKAEQDKVNAAQKENNAAQQQAIENLQQDFSQYNGRLSGLESKVDNLDSKMNKGLSLMAAMAAVDFQNVEEGEMAIGAGVGHYGNAQSVAIGVAYSPVQNLNLNLKYSVTAGDVKSSAIGAGASYKFRVK